MVVVVVTSSESSAGQEPVSFEHTFVISDGMLIEERKSSGNTKIDTDSKPTPESIAMSNFCMLHELFVLFSRTVVIFIFVVGVPGDDGGVGVGDDDANDEDDEEGANDGWLALLLLARMLDLDR